MTGADLTIEWLKIAQGLFGTLVGGGLVLLGGWLTDHRRTRAEEMLRDRREKALLTGMFAVRNYVSERINEWSEEGLLSRLEPLRTAQSYVHRLIDKAPGESESLMITVIQIGLSIDALIATIDRRSTDPSLKNQTVLATLISRQVDEIAASIEQFDVVSGQELTILSDDDLSKFPGFPERQSEGSTDR